MGNSPAAGLQSELARPLDAGDITSLSDAKVEIARMRALMASLHEGRQSLEAEEGEAEEEGQAEAEPQGGAETEPQGGAEAEPQGGAEADG